MQTAKEITDQLIKEAQQMHKFDIKVRVQDQWMPFGSVPFDIKIKDGIATVTVIAKNEEEARQQVLTYMESDDWI